MPARARARLLDAAGERRLEHRVELREPRLGAHPLGVEAQQRAQQHPRRLGRALACEAGFRAKE
eukprot:3140798-Pleurochrysis_carterae.AAC.1